MDTRTTYDVSDYGANVVGRRPLSFLFRKKFIDKHCHESKLFAAASINGVIFI
jgi:hypothetical protein